MGKRQRNNGAENVHDLNERFNLQAISGGAQAAGVGAVAKVLGTENIELVIDQFDASERRVLALTGGLRDARQKASAKEFKQKYPKYQSTKCLLDNSNKHTAITLPSFADMQLFEEQLKQHLKEVSVKNQAKQGLPTSKQIRKQLAMQKKAKAQKSVVAKSKVADVTKTKSVQKHGALKKKTQRTKRSKDVDME